MELKVGMYVRTEYGISKIVNIYSEKTGTFIETDNGLGNCNMSTRGKLHKGIYILEEDYKIFIDNNVKNAIIDLIEVGDYVNGSYVYSVVEENKNTGQPRVLFTEEDGVLGNGDIKSIVTKEQFSQMEYKVKND